LPSAELAGFHRPETVGDALRLKQELGPASVYLGGGTWLNSSACDRPVRHVISLADLALLRRLERTRNGLHIGAMVSLQELAMSSLAPESLKRAVLNVGNRNVRNQATVGGTVAAGRSGADVLPTLMALECVCIVENPGTAALIPVGEYVASGSRPSEGLITALLVPATGGRSVGAAALKRSAAARPVVAVAASLARDGEMLAKPILALAGSSFDARHVPELERALDGDYLPPRDALEALVRGHVAFEDDPEHTGAYKQRLAGTLAWRAFSAAFAAAAGGGA
jgi:putative selenate reductase FAD-binding subunit